MMNDSFFDVIIIGGGASGLMLAASLELNGVRGLILEGSHKPGSKLLMSGGGRCNITHGGPAKDIVYAYGDAGPALRRCLYRHNNLNLAAWFNDHGVELAGENGEPVDLNYGPGGMDSAKRLFPASMKSGDILNALFDAVKANGWEIRTGAKVTTVGNGPDFWEVTTGRGERFTAKELVIATGGITYPETGSDGSMFTILKEIGLKITDPTPALAPVYVENYPYADLAGISVPEVTVIAFGRNAACTCNGKTARMKGDILFTHEGFSGPVILNISRYAETGETLRICYNKDLTELPVRLQRVLRDRARGPLGDVRTNVLAALLNQDDFTIKGVDERGMVTAGGVALAEMDLSTMRARNFEGMHVIGEALDADGITGGYNLQMCWSTACTAADDLRRVLFD